MRSLRPATSLVIAALLCRLVAACAGGPPPRPPPSYAETVTPEEAVGIIQERSRGLDSIHASLKIRSERGQLKGYLWAEANGRLRIHARRLLWPAMDLLMEGDRVLLFMPRRSKALSATLSELGPRGGPLIASRDLFGALLGSRGGARAAFGSDGKTLIITGGVAGGGREVWTYDRKHLLLRRLARSDAAGEEELVVEVGDYVLFGGRWWPGSALLRTPGQRMEIRLLSVQENPSIDPEVFRIDLPQDTVIVGTMDELDE